MGKLAALGGRLHAWGIPGWRRNSWWRAGIAVAGYAVLLLLALVDFGSNAAAALIYLAAVAGALAVALNVGGLRRRVPGYGRRGAVPFWTTALALVGIIALLGGAPTNKSAAAAGAEAAPSRRLAPTTAPHLTALPATAKPASAAQPVSARAAPTIVPTPDVPDSVKQEATDLLGAAVAKREGGEFGLALELGRQALGKWPDYADAKSFLADTQPKATAAAQQAIQRATAAAQAQATADAQAKAAATAAAQATALVKPAQDRQMFLTALRAAGIDSSLIVRVDRGVVDDEVRVTVANPWHFEPYQIRLQAAQNLWQLWASIHTPDRPDVSRLRLVDLNGNDVGGSGWLGGSLVDVKK